MSAGYSDHDRAGFMKNSGQQQRRGRRQRDKSSRRTVRGLCKLFASFSSNSRQACLVQ